MYCVVAIAVELIVHTYFILWSYLYKFAAWNFDEVAKHRNIVCWNRDTNVFVSIRAAAGEPVADVACRGWHRGRRGRRWWFISCTVLFDCTQVRAVISTLDGVSNSGAPTFWPEIAAGSELSDVLADETGPLDLDLLHSGQLSFEFWN